MSVRTTVHTARVAHDCEECCERFRWNWGVGSPKTIHPGHRYVRSVAFPDGEIDTGDSPWTMKHCVSCAIELVTRYHYPNWPEIGACAQVCCGDVVCARPDGHGDEHSCRRCAREKSLVGAR